MVPVQVTGNLQKNIAKRPMAATMTVSHCFTACGWLNIEHVVCCLQVELLPGTGSLGSGVVKVPSSEGRLLVAAPCKEVRFWG